MARRLIKRGPSSAQALPNNALQLTSGGFMRASRASFMRRLQLSAVLGGRLKGQRTMAPASPGAEAIQVIYGSGSARYHRGGRCSGSTS